MNIEDIKKEVESRIDSNAEDLIGIAKTILDMPEPGYREFKTSKYTEAVSYTHLRAHET